MKPRTDNPKPRGWRGNSKPFEIVTQLEGHISPDDKCEDEDPNGSAGSPPPLPFCVYHPSKTTQE